MHQMEKADGIFRTNRIGGLIGLGYFPIGILGQVWYLIVSILDLCPLSYFHQKLAMVMAGGSVHLTTLFPGQA